jgi:excinuclease UvrABC nuclease subunit
MPAEQITLTAAMLPTLPKAKGVYAIFARNKENGKPCHCKFVGETDNIRGETSAHFSKNEPNEGLRVFMQSGKTKLMVYELLPNTSKADRGKTEKEWVKEMHPKFNKKES